MAEASVLSALAKIMPMTMSCLARGLLLWRNNVMSAAAVHVARSESISIIAEAPRPVPCVLPMRKQFYREHAPCRCGRR